MCTPDQMECVSKISIKKQKCLKKCSGLLVASFDKNQQYQSKEFISKLSAAYWTYKGFFDFPYDFRSK